MCLFITMTLPKGADLEVAGHVLSACGRQLVPLKQAPEVAADEAYFLVSGLACDCDTRLGEARRDVGAAAGWARRHDNRRKAMEKKGWSESKIARAMADVKGAHEHRAAARNVRGAAGRDIEIAQWSSIVRNVPKAAGADHVGLMLHQYSGAIDEEEILARRELCWPDALDDFLLNIEEDVLCEFRPPKRGEEREKAG